MDLTSLLAGAGPGEVGPSKTNTMEELRQSQYKRTGAKTATERRTLRSIQVSCFRSRCQLLECFNFHNFCSGVTIMQVEGPLRTFKMGFFG